MKPAAQDRLRVLHIGKYYWPCRGGIETHVRSLCERLSTRADVRVIACNTGPATVRERVGAVEVVRVGTWGTLRGAPLCPAMAGHIRRAPADLVHLHLPHPTGVLAWLASGHRAPLVLTYHSDIVRQRLLGKALQPILLTAIGRAAAVIFSAPQLRDKALLAPPPDRCRVIPFGIEPDDFERCDPEAVARIRARCGPRVVMSAGRLVYYKGFEYLIRAMARVEGTLLLAGDGPLRAALQAEARRAGIAGRVIFTGAVEDLLPYYHAADVFVLPSVARSEAFGIVQLEAMACGKPVVNTHVDSAVPFVSIGGVTGLTVPLADAAALAEAIHLLLDNPDLRARYGEAARRRVRQEFSAGGMADRTLQLYLELKAAERSPNAAPLRR
jgi:rhamnosyl/mannosyltransferase